jgi:dTMP kinase
MNPSSCTPKRFSLSPLPNVDPGVLPGLLIALEGIAGAGCTTQIHCLQNRLEFEGFSVLPACADESKLVKPEWDNAKENNVMNPRSLALLRATAFYDQLESEIIPALHAGRVVLANRYCLTAIAEAITNGLEPDWIKTLYGSAIIPDAVITLHISAQTAIGRFLKRDQTLACNQAHDEMSINNHYIARQTTLAKTLQELHIDYDAIEINGELSIDSLTEHIWGIIQTKLKKQ